MKTIEVQLGYEKKWRNRQEYHTVPSATTKGLKHIKYGLSLQAFAKDLLDKKLADREDLMEIKRDGTLCFNVMSVGEWSDKGIYQGKQPEWLKK